MIDARTVTKSEVPEQFELGARVRGWIVLADIQAAAEYPTARHDLKPWTYRNTFRESHDRQGAARP